MKNFQETGIERIGNRKKIIIQDYNENRYIDDDE